MRRKGVCLLGTLLLALFVLFGCKDVPEEPTIQSLEIIYEDDIFNDENVLIINEITEINQVRFRVIFSDESSEIKTLQNQYLSSADLSKLETPGTYEVTITYEGKTVTLRIKVEEENIVDPSGTSLNSNGILTWDEFGSSDEYDIYIDGEMIVEDHSETSINLLEEFPNLNDGNLYLIEVKYSSLTIGSLFHQNEDEAITRMVAPYNLYSEGNVLLWSWVDITTDCNGFEIYIDGNLFSTQYAPRFDMDDLTKDVFDTTEYDIQIVALGGLKQKDSLVTKYLHVYEVLNYDVTFDFNYQGSTPITERSVRGLIAERNPERSGYTFNGWYLMAEDGETMLQRWNFDSKVTKDMTLKADWVSQQSSGGIKIQNAPSVSVYGTSLTWYAIEGANGYRLEILDQYRNTIDTINSISYTSYDFYDYKWDDEEAERSRIYVKIQTRGDGITSTNSSWVERSIIFSNAYQSLPTVQAILSDYNIGVFYWDDIDNYYHIKVTDKNSQVIYQGSSTLAEFRLPKDAPADFYDVEIETASGGIKEFEIRKIRLLEPEITNIEIEDEQIRLTWSEVINANQYLLNVNDVEYTSETNSLLIDLTEGIHQITLQALDTDTNFLISRPSQCTLKVDNGNILLLSGENLEVLEVLVLNVASYTIPDTIQIVRENALVNNEVVMEIFILHEIETIEMNAFNNLPNAVITVFSYSDAPIGWDLEWNGTVPATFKKASESDDFSYNIENDGATIFLYKGEAEVVEIPEVINGKLVRKIAANTFANTDFVKEVIVPNTVTTIESGAFSGLVNLERTSLPFVGGSIDDEETYFGFIFGAENYTDQQNYIPSGLKKVTIGGGVLGDYAFSGISSLETIVLEEVTKIGTKAFRNCSNLKMINIPLTVEVVGAYIFENTRNVSVYINQSSRPSGWDYYWEYAYYSPALYWNVSEVKENGMFLYAVTQQTITIIEYIGTETTVVIPEQIDGKNVTVVARNAIYNNTDIISVKITHGIIEIKDNFEDCPNLTMVFIPNTVITVGRLGYQGSNITFFSDLLTEPNTWSYYWKYNEEVYWGAKGVGTHEDYHYIIYGDDTVGITGYEGEAADLEIPETIEGHQVTTIEKETFVNLHSLKSLILPDTLHTIKEYAFYYCSITYIYIPDSVINVGTNAFNSCSVLTIYAEAASVPTTWSHTWNYDDSHNSPRATFWNVKEIVKTPTYVYGLKDDEAIIIKYLGSDALVNIPTTLADLPVKALGNNVFLDSISITDIFIPDCISTVLISSFATTVSVNLYVQLLSKPDGWNNDWNYNFNVYWNVDSILQDDLFVYAVHNNNTVTLIDYHGQVENVIVPDSLNGKTVVAIGNSAFYNRVDIKSVSLPDTITNIGNRVFMQCISLEQIVLPAQIQKINDYLFYDCSSLQSVTIPNSVTEIGIAAFYDCYNLTELVIPSNLKRIGESAFCYSGIKALTLPQGMLEIGANAFNRSDLSMIFIPASITQIGYNAFYSIYGTDLFIYVEAAERPATWNSSWINSENQVVWNVSTMGTYEGFGYVLGNDEIIIISYDGEANSITVPSKIDNHVVTTIGDKAFKHTTVSEIIIPQGITKIGKEAFCQAYELLNVVLPNSLRIIEDNAFINCDSIESLNIPEGVTHIGEYAFAAMEELTEVTLPNTLIELGAFAFYSDDNLETINLPEGLTVINEMTFGYCTSLTSITIPTSLTTIGTQAFFTCDKLVSVTIPSGVRSIGYQAFHDCDILEEVYLPSSVETIDDDAFSVSEFNTTSKLVIYAEPTSRPSGWSSTFTNKEVVWGYNN